MIATPYAPRQVHDVKAAGGAWNAALAAAGVLAAALALAGCIQFLETRLLQPERAVLATGLLFALILAAVPIAYVLRLRGAARPETAGLAILATCSVLLLAIYFFWVSWYVFFPADIWIWSESDFVNDILKMLVGYPLYSPPANGDSMHYVPGPQLLTYALAWLAGKGGSIPAYRVIQMAYTALAAFVAVLCCRRILRLARPESRSLRSWLWDAFSYATLLLVATNSITNRFAHNLHGDALAQLANVVAFYLLLAYIDTRSPRVLAAMAVVVPLGFLVKQNVVVWGAFYGVFLLVWDRAWKRFAMFAVASGVLFAAIVGICDATWGGPFLFWVFAELSGHTVSQLRSFQHVLDSWAYFAAGLLGGVLALRGRRADVLVGAWLISLALLSLEAYTSGIEWMLNHMGPGCLLAGIWLMAGLAAIWDYAMECQQQPRRENWIQAAALTAAIALMYSGMGLVRIPLRPVSADAYRYVHDIENAFQGQPAEKVLLDAGTWVYAKDRVIMHDRGTSISVLASSNRDIDFSAFRSRIAAKTYSKILVRNLHEHDCWYENVLWPKPRGLRKVLLDNYRETGHIRAAAGPPDVKNWAEDPFLFGEITILEPKNAASN